MWSVGIFRFRILFSIIILAAAIEMYKKEEVTLGRAAEIAGMGLIEFKEALKDRGIKIKVPKTSMNALDKQVARIRKIRGG